MSLMKDELGNVSSARWLLWITLPFTLVFIGTWNGVMLWHVLHDPTAKFFEPVAALSALVSLCLVLAGWAGGSRMMAYISPQIGKVAAGIASAVRTKSGDFVAQQWKVGEPDEGLL